jgi:hypothetical protein
MSIQSLSDLRKSIKPLGFKIKTKKMSWGQHANYVHIESNQELNFNVCDKPTADRWAPCIQFLRDHRDEVIALKETERLYGLQEFGPLAVLG